MIGWNQSILKFMIDFHRLTDTIPAMNKSSLIKLGLLLVLCAGLSGCEQILTEILSEPTPATQTRTPTVQQGSAHSGQVSAGIRRIKEAYADRDSDFFVEARAQVVKVLRDDTEGDQHQRFIVEVAPSHTLLVSHNIDLAPRVAGLQAGDWVSFRGEYVWNNKGGIIHWTHHDPRGRHEGGWIEHDGNVYK